MQEFNKKSLIVAVACYMEERGNSDADAEQMRDHIKGNREGNKMATKTESIEKKVVPYYHKELEEDIIGHYDGENKIELIPLCTKEYTYFSTTEEDEFLQIKKEDEGYVFDIVDSAFDHIDELGFLFHSDIEEEEE